ncbi:MAG: Gfo/Idh/MocA family oxidoreductase [Treponema sp.]|jgi:predicted dehydrogenase|nr:Gfo/Idh/MocA family oxidoreductase [Treponema sp.]
MKPVRAAVVGLGRIGSLLENDPRREKPCTHAGAISGSGDCVLVAGADTDGERRGLFRETWGVPVYAAAETMLEEQKPDILCVATHPDSHLLYCELAARRGVKVAVCEKPLADSLEKAKKIARLHESGKITVIVNHERRYSEDYRAAAAILRGGGLGAALSVRAALYMGKTRRLVDVLWHDGTHLADAAMFLLDAALKHKETRGAELSGRTGTAYLAGGLEISGGAVKSGAKSREKKREIPFIMEIGAERDHVVFELEFSCEKGRLRIGNGIFEVWESVESPYAAGFRSLEKKREGFLEATGYFSNMIKDAAACCRKKNKIPQSKALDGLRVIKYLNSVRPWIG